MKLFRPIDSGRPRQTVSFRTSLLRSLMILIAALAGAILIVSFLGARNAIRTLCQDLVNSGTDYVESNIRSFFKPIPPVLHLLQDWSKSGILDYDDPEQLNEAFMPLLNSLPQISGLSVGFSDGSGYFLGRNSQMPGESFQMQIVDAESAGKSSRWFQGIGEQGILVEESREDGYDPRTRPWYAGLREKSGDSGIFWTEPYAFFSTEGLGITASIALETDDGKSGVIALDLILEDISRLGESLEISPNGFLLVVTEEVKLIGLPRHPALTDDHAKSEAYLKTPADLGIPLFTQASIQFLKRFDLQPGERLSLEVAQSEMNTPFRWSFDGEGWWSYVRGYVVDGGPLLWIGVTVPESDFLSELEAGRTYVLIISLAALILACFLSLKLARRYSQPIQSLIDQSERLRVLNTEEAAVKQSDIREIDQLYEAQDRMRLALDSFAKYVPSDVVRELLEKGEAAVIGGRNTSMSILFTDIAGFTSISEKMSPEGLTAHMADYFDAMIEIITRHHGTVDKLIGDAIVAFWGAPKENQRHAHDAILTALRCQEALERLNEEWEANGLPSLPTRFGISTGEVMVGNVGSVNRLSYTALGDSVNLASRLEGANKYFGTRILAAEKSVISSGDSFRWRELDKVKVLGRSQPETIYELLGERNQVSEKRLEEAKQYQVALTKYWSREFDEALRILKELSEDSEPDLAVDRLENLCKEALEVGIEPEWDGVSKFFDK
ncbi:MAG: adenylate/guanylate cyclase domain-containing protein [Verrucomicrobiota bacterium]